MSDAFVPMPVPITSTTPSLTEQIDALLAKNPLPDARTGQVKRGRGRPPGTPNRVKTPDGGVNPPSRITIPGGRKETPSSPVDDSEAKKAAKKAKADEYSAWINKELNDQLFMLIIGATSMPAEMLYKQGRVPPKSATNPDLTDLGNAIAIPADVADSWGKLLAELTYTDAGKNLTKAVEGKSLGIVFAALSAVYSTYRYTQQLKPFIDSVKTMKQEPTTEEQQDG